MDKNLHQRQGLWLFAACVMILLSTACGEQGVQQADITIEYGLESISDDTLKKVNRGHDVQSYLEALELTAGRGIKICTHIIFGFPWEDKSQWLGTADWLSGKPFEFLKIHQLHVVKGTQLALMYERKPFDLMDSREYIELIVKFLEELNPEIIIQRLFGEAPPKVLLAPHWGMRTSQLLQILDRRLEEENSWQGKCYK